jgi:nucleotide-binding universal stress UspA family protein
MSTSGESLTIRRIAVTLDSSAGTARALDIAARLAAAVGAELQGVFVEDVNLARLATLPFAREVRASSLMVQGIDADSLQRDLRALARQAEVDLQWAANSLGVTCSFRVWRGQAALDTVNAGIESDILSPAASLLGVYRALPPWPARPPATAPALDTISVLFSASPQARKALTAACYLARSTGASLRVLLPAQPEDTATQEKLAAEVLSAQAQPARFVAIGDQRATRLTEALGGSGNRVLIVEADHPLLHRLGLARCLEKFTGPVLFVR